MTRSKLPQLLLIDAGNTRVKAGLCPLPESPPAHLPLFETCVAVPCGTPLPWNPGADNLVHALAVSGNTVYAGGYFTSIGGSPRNFLAALAAGGAGTALPWRPEADNVVFALAMWLFFSQALQLVLPAGPLEEFSARALRSLLASTV